MIEDQLAIKSKMRVQKDEKQTIHLVSFWLGQTVEKREKKKKRKERKKMREKSKNVCF